VSESGAEPTAEQPTPGERSSAEEDAGERSSAEEGPGERRSAEEGAGERSSAQESASQLVEELRRAKVSDVLMQTSSLLASLAFGKLAPDVRDLDQARQAIDALKALTPLLDEGPRRDVQQVVANLQLAYVDAASEPAGS
jgi:hypothetical protein